jgi:hypothetical protein
MTRLSDDDALRLLKDAMPPMHAESAPAHDLWPDIERRVRTHRRPPSVVDWLLLAAAVTACVIYPSAAFVPLLHF